MFVVYFFPLTLPITIAPRPWIAFVCDARARVQFTACLCVVQFHLHFPLLLLPLQTVDCVRLQCTSRSSFFDFDVKDRADTDRETVLRGATINSINSPGGDGGRASALQCAFADLTPATRYLFRLVVSRDSNGGGGDGGDGDGDDSGGEVTKGFPSLPVWTPVCMRVLSFLSIWCRSCVVVNDMSVLLFSYVCKCAR
jgi:hypothetical protein